MWPYARLHAEVIVYPTNLPQGYRSTEAFMEKQICKIQKWTVVAIECTAELSSKEHSRLQPLLLVPGGSTLYLHGEHAS